MCKAGCNHEELKANKFVWAGLEWVGLQKFTYDDGEETLEMRNCVCGSTLAIVLESK